MIDVVLTLKKWALRGGLVFPLRRPGVELDLCRAHVERHSVELLERRTVLMPDCHNVELS